MGKHDYNTTSTFVTPPYGKRPEESRITGVGESRSGKSVEIQHRDGVTEVINERTGKERFKVTTPAYPTYPTSIVRDSYERRPSVHVDINLGGIQITEHNRYLRENFYINPPVFQNNVWTAPVYSPVIYSPEIPILPLGEIYRMDRGTTSIRQIQGAGHIANQLQAAGIYNDQQMLDRTRTPAQRDQLAQQFGIDPYALREVAGQADMMRIDGVGGVNSRLLADAGIRSVQDLARYTWDPGMLVSAIQNQAYAHGNAVPSQYQIQSWIQQARALPVVLYDNPYNSAT